MTLYTALSAKYDPANLGSPREVTLRLTTSQFNAFQASMQSGAQIQIEYPSAPGAPAPMTVWFGEASLLKLVSLYGVSVENETFTDISLSW